VRAASPAPARRQADLPDGRTANHKAIFNSVGLTPVDYPYYDSSTIGLALSSFLDFLRTAPAQSVILLHACAHNPTGVDPTRDEWKEIAKIFKERGHFAFFDCAYRVHRARLSAGESRLTS
jgi:aspartate aminotransferase